MQRLRLRYPLLLLIVGAQLPTVVAWAHKGDHEVMEVMMVAGVVPGSAADAAGIEAGDRILSWEGQQITTQQELDTFLAGYEPGDQISLTVERQGEIFEMSLTFGERAGGGVSIGVSLGVASPSPPGSETEGLTGAECLAWVDETYRMASMAQSFGLDLQAEIEQNRACMEHDVQRMAEPIPQPWCDNVFKVHCSGLDLLAEIGDAQVARCTSALSASLGVDISRNREWNTCGEQKVFERYSMRGEASDEATCRSILIEECRARVEG